MSSEIREDKQFDGKNLYFQWLQKHEAWPQKYHRYIVIGLWIVCLAYTIYRILFDVSYQSSRVAGYLVYYAFRWIPAIIIFTDFLFIMPYFFRRDSASGTIDSLFSSPVETKDVIADLRRFTVRMNLQKLAPIVIVSVFFLLKNFYWIVRLEIGDYDSIWWVLSKGLVPFSVWWFCLEAGIVTCVLPARASDYGGHLLFLLIPWLVVFMHLGYRLGCYHWMVWFSDVELGTQVGSRTMFHYAYFYNRAWCFAHEAVILMVFAGVLFFLGRKLMHLRRQGVWK